jgi:RNA polymerase sigma-70 factor, ECF subfamily
MTTVAPLFVRHLDDARRAAIRPDALGALDSALREGLARARASWPGVHLGDDMFLRYLAERLPPLVAPEVALARLNVSDLYLACGCAHAVPTALAALERNLIPQITAFLLRRYNAAGFIDDVIQTLLTRVLVPDAEGNRRIGSYRGEGELLGWLSTVAGRVLVDVCRSKERATEHATEEARVPEPLSGDPEVQYLKTKYGREFRTAFHETLAGLPVREANVLRHYYLDGMTADAIAALYRVSSTTIRRWLEATREKLLDATSRNLRDRLNVDAEELDSIFRLLESEIWAAPSATPLVKRKP